MKVLVVMAFMTSLFVGSLASACTNIDGSRRHSVTKAPANVTYDQNGNPVRR